MEKIMKIYLIASLAIGFISCEGPLSEQYEPELNVFSILWDCYQIHEVIVDRTYKIEEPSEPYIDNAIVILSGENFTDTLLFSENTSSYLTDPITIQPQESYKLKVVVEGFDTVFAKTTVPGDFAILFPQGDTVTLADTIIFSKSSGAYLYCCILLSDPPRSKFTFWYKPDTLDSLIKIPVNDCLRYAPTDFYTIYIRAFDRNYFEYYRGQEDSVLQAGITGGLGLFGSTFTKITVAYVITE